MMLFYISSMIFIISGLLLTILLITSMKSLFNRSILSAFECGFDPYNSARIHFSLQFFLIAVIFLIFDIEIVILLPLPLVQGISMPWAYFNIMTVFILLLLLGTYYEWINGALSWVI